VAKDSIALQAGMDESFGPALTVGGLRAILEEFPDDMLVVTSGLDGHGFAYIWPGKCNDIRVERAVAITPTQTCDMDRPKELGIDPDDGIDVLAIGD